ncbi:hypothetical protein [Streptomyces roseochromogenus]|uniref:hypothetical protein n=1 Tax=Streptomyces roseochromogenus TaxID=285450 RepID=UPI001319CEA9|nr:hypothetical protein [Streptomyces roseochromogenus]
MSARIGRLRVFVLIEGGDDAVEVVQDLLVHLDEPLLSAGLGGGDDLQDFLALLAVLGKKSRVVTNIGQVRQASLNYRGVP